MTCLLMVLMGAIVNVHWSSVAGWAEFAMPVVLRDPESLPLFYGAAIAAGSLVILNR